MTTTATALAVLGLTLPLTASALSEPARPNHPMPQRVVAPAHHARTTPTKRPAAKKPRRVPITTINVVAAVPIAGGQAAVDRCAGPVEVLYPGATPQIVQHDYCGGAWVLRLHRGEVIRLTGAVAGTYAVSPRRRVIPDGTPVSGVNGLGDLVAQSCIPGTSSIQLVGLTRVRP